MKQVYRITRLLLLCGVGMATASPLLAQRTTTEHPDLEALYRQIDEEIERSPHYVAEYQKRISQRHDNFMAEHDGERRFLVAEELFSLYKPFKNDSAIHYAQVCIDLADSLGLDHLAGRYRALMARQCSNASMYVESLRYLGEVDKERLDRQGLTDYYDAYMHVCGEIANYSLIPSVKNQYWAMQDHYRDSVLQVADEGSDQYLHLQMSALCARQQYQEALKVSDRWINKVAEGTHADAYASYYRHIVFDKLGNSEMVRYWLGKSALSDIKSAVMDQASLINLAELLNYDGDLDRSYRYIRYTWQCNNAFNTRLRASQIAPVLSVIERNYTNVSRRSQLILTVSAAVFCVMAVCLLLMFRYVSRQKKRLSEAKRELTEANEELTEANHKLKKMNERVTRYNKQLFDINYELRKEKDESLQLP